MRIKIVIFILFSLFIKSQTQYFDQSFATNGILSQVSPYTNVSFIYEAGALTADNKIIAVGNHRTQQIQYPNQQNTNIVRRLNMDGSVDTTFNVYTRPPQPLIYGQNPSQGHDDAYFTKVKIQGDGKILLATPINSRVIRLNANGLLDTSFATNGTFYPADTLAALGLYATFINDIFYTSDNKILVCFEGEISPANTPAMIVLCLNSNGTVDTSFGNNGVITQDGGLGHLLIHNTKLLLYSGDGNPTIKRYEATGQLDTTFHNGVLAVPLISGYSTTFNSWATNGSSIYMSGIAQSDTSNVPLIVIVKLMQNGVLDNNFGNNGLVTERYYPTSVVNYVVSTNFLFQNLLIDQNENLYVATSGGMANAFDNQFIKKFTSQGMVDMGFGNNGIIEVDLNGQENFRSALIQADGKILTFGTTNSTPRRGIIARLQNNFTALSTENVTKEPSKLQIYPNPVSNYINVVPDLKDSVADATIIDVSGKVVMTGDLKHNQLDVSQLISGTYLIKIGDKTAKFIKQ